MLTMSSISTSIDILRRAEDFGNKYVIFISDDDMGMAYDSFSDRERKSCDRLMGGSLAEKSLALTMILYTLQQNADKQTVMTDEHATTTSE